VIKNLMGMPTKALQNSFGFQKQRYEIKEILSSNFYLFFIHHHPTLNPLTPNTPYFANSFTELRGFCNVQSLRCRAKNALGASESEEQCVRIQPGLSFYVFAHQPIFPF
jgi:hypothetical protein